MTDMKPGEVVDCLATLPTFASVPRTELEWLAARGDIRRIDAGGCIIEVGDVTDRMFILLSGRAAVYAVATGGMRMMVDIVPGAVAGALPYSRTRVSPAAVMVEEDAVTLIVPAAHFPELVRECQGVTEALVHWMLDRARQYQRAVFNQDRLETAGRLASGLAHELNNPASAATRYAQSLAAHVAAAEAASRLIAAAGLSDAQLESIDAIRRACLRPAPSRSALDAADREDDIADWLAQHGIDVELAEPLAACDVELDALHRIADVLPADSMHAAVAWVARGIAVRSLAREIGTATGRIHDLVDAVKGFTFMDREAVPADVNIARGLADTIAILDHKARTKSLTVQLQTAEDLPRVYGFGSEINQVWEKLIDNAIDAAAQQGNVTITATARGDSIVVRVADDGAGISEAIRDRIFDPFFSTKSLGKGMGLGLDLARRIVYVHHGDIDFTSQPGRTVFRVRLPLSGARAVRTTP